MGTTLFDAGEQTREIVPGTAGNVVPTLLRDADGTTAARVTLGDRDMPKYIAILFLAASMAAVAQDPPKPTELQSAKIQLAIKDYQIAQIQATEAQRVLQSAQQAAQAQIDAVRKELGLDVTWDYDFQRNVFVKKTVPKELPKK